MVRRETWRAWMDAAVYLGYTDGKKDAAKMVRGEKAGVWCRRVWDEVTEFRAWICAY